MYWRVLGVVALLSLLVVALLYAARTESPSTVVRATSTPTVAPATPTQQQSVVPSATATATVVVGVPISVSGAVYWNHHPQAGVRVEISELGAPWGCVGSAAKATTTTSTDGAFTVAVVGLSANTPVGAFVCAYGAFLDGGRAAVGTGSTRSVGSIDLAREITGLSGTYARSPVGDSRNARRTCALRWSGGAGSFEWESGVPGEALGRASYERLGALLPIRVFFGHDEAPWERS